MNRIIGLLGVFALLALSSLSVEAACGGGGYKPSQRTERKEVRQTSSQTVSTQEVSTSSSSERTPVLDTSRFDAISGRLELSDDQSKDIAKAKKEIKKRQAKGQMSDPEAKQEFERRVTKILNEKQLKRYTSGSE